LLVVVEASQDLVMVEQEAVVLEALEKEKHHQIVTLLLH
jgi:hypothetical protein